jgi:glucose/arabinose dehydrogenase
LILLPTASLNAATLPPGFTESQVGSDISSPTAMAFAPDGRLFVSQQTGELRVIENDVLLPTPFVTLSVDSRGERGLLGVAFDPNFAVNQYVYVYYTTSTPQIHNRVSRFTANGSAAVPGSEVVILELDNSNGASNHNGGALHFGPDGKLYISTGENADPPNSQSLDNLLGKILRINTDGTIPTDNPFYSVATGNNRAIWALGLRNPFTFGFQPGTGRMFINDVGAAAWEEINDGIAGSNYGWPICEAPCSPTNPSFRDPVYAYQHSGGACAIVGAAFHDPATGQFPVEYDGKYFFADYCAGWIHLLDLPNYTSTSFATGLSWPVDLQVGPDGSLFYLQRGSTSSSGQVWRIYYTASQAPNITQHPASISVSVGQPATFSVSATGATPLSYQWQRYGVDIPGATSKSYTIASAMLADTGAPFRCVVSNPFGTATSNEATLTVVTNQPPTATITTPVAGTLYSGGQTLTYAGTGTDPETGALPPSAFTWEVVFHHDAHTHPFLAPTSGATGGVFVIPTVGETSANVWYRIHLTVTDAGGVTHTVFRDVAPQTATFTLQTTPAGLQVTLDGQPTATPTAVLGVVGIQRTLGVLSPQSLGGTPYVFSAWSDGSPPTRTIATPAVATTYTAAYLAVPNQPPTATITTPVAGTLYSGGQTLTYAGTGTDPETGALPPSAFTWEVVFHHDAHTHPFLAPTSGATGGVFVIPTVGETSANVWYRIHLTVTDAGGVTHTVFRDVAPQTATFTLQTTPAGLQVTLDGQPTATPTAVLGVVGIQRTLGVLSPQSLGGTPYVFSAWSDGSPPTRTIATPAVATTYTAAYTAVPAACSYTLSPTSKYFTSAGGTGSVSMTTTTGCAWTAVSNASWITITAGASGTGNGTVSYSVEVNTTGAMRTGTITIGGETFTVTQIATSGNG